MATATPKGAAIELPELGDDLNEDGAAEEMLRRFLPPEDAKKQPSDKAKGENKDDSAEPEDDDEDETPAEKPEDKSDDDEEGDEDEETTESETVVKIKVGDEEHEVPVSKLTRLYGQEAALTKKSMEVADQRKQAEAQLGTNTAATQALLARAQSRWEPYSKLDFHLLAAQVGKGELTSEEYQALRQSAQAAHEDVQFLSQHLDGFSKALQERTLTQVREKAIECNKVLSLPTDKGGIEGWSEKLYDDIRSFAVSQGAPAEMINQIVEPWAFRMLHSAMLYARGKAKGKVVTVKKNNTPKRIVKTSESPAAERRSGPDSAKANKAFQKLSSTGSADDAAEVMLARWAARKDAADE